MYFFFHVEYVPDFKVLAREDEMLIKSRQRPHTAFPLH